MRCSFKDGFILVKKISCYFTIYFLYPTKSDAPIVQSQPWQCCLSLIMLRNTKFSDLHMFKRLFLLWKNPLPASLAEEDEKYPHKAMVSPFMKSYLKLLRCAPKTAEMPSLRWRRCDIGFFTRVFPTGSFFFSVCYTQSLFSKYDSGSDLSYIYKC